MHGKRRRRSPLRDETPNIKGLKYTTPEVKEVVFDKSIGLMGGDKTGTKLSDVLPRGIHGGGSVTYKPTEKLTLRASGGGSLYKPKGGKGTVERGVSLSLQKKFKGGEFSFGVSKGSGSKPFYGVGLKFNI